MPHFDTAGNIINAAALELGLASTSVANPFASTDPNILQLCALLNRVGRMLVRSRPWSQLTRQHTFDTEDGVETYALPASYSRMKDQTIWNRDTGMPMGGPASSQQWQAMKARTASGMIVKPFRIFGNLLYIYPVPTVVESIYYEYISTYWVGPLASTPTASEATAAADPLWFDEPLLVAGLKLAFARAKGRDTSGLQTEYLEAYDAAAGQDLAAPILSSAPCVDGFFLGPSNLPDTGYGS